MTSAVNSVLLIAVNGESVERVAEKVRAADLDADVMTSLVQAHDDLLSHKYSACVVRSDGADESLLEILQFVSTHRLPTKVIVSLKAGGVDDAVRFMKAGAADFIVGESVDGRLVESLLRNASSYHEARSKSDDAPDTSAHEPVLVGLSPAISEIRSAINLVAKSQTTVLITGESGTGKEVVARMVHRQSSRALKPFVALNCATLPKDVIENELFGHEKGAFTGALLKKPGCFELANGGTLLFDEIAEMSLETQAKLLRAIETQKFRRLGGKEEVNVDVRMIAATNKNISAALKSRELREDLYYRLSVIEIFIPPVRERKEDILQLVDYFLSVFAGKYGKPLQHFTEGCLEMLGAYEWPGNVREIRNVVERALVICPDEYIGPRYLPERIQQHVPKQYHINIPLGTSTQEAERILILQTLASAGNNKAKAAKILGVSRKTLHNKLASFSQS